MSEITIKGAVTPTAGTCFIFQVQKMAFKFAFVAALCIAQGLAFQPLDALRRRDICKNPGVQIPFEFEEAVHEFDEVRESVSMAAIDAYGKGENFEVILACFREQRGNYLQLGLRVSEMMEDASQKLAQKLGEKAEKYAKFMSIPLRNIAITMKKLPEVVYDFIKNKEFFKAIEAMRNARLIVEENARAVGKIMQDMVAEVPELADAAEQMAREIREEARKGVETINKAFKKCVEEGGPKKFANAE